MASSAVAAFAAVSWLLALGVVGLARASATAMSDDSRARGAVEPPAGGEPVSGDVSHATPTSNGRPDGERPRTTRDPPPDRPALSTPVLVLNVVLTQGGVVTVLVVATIAAGLPPSLLGVEAAAAVPRMLAVGLGLGLLLYGLDEALSAVAGQFDLLPDEQLRSSLAPDSPTGWLLLLGVVLPVVGVAEELLFRAALIGVTAGGLNLPLLPVMVSSSLLFGAAHGIQGIGGVLVTGVLGLGLAAAFVATGSLPVVVVAHYVVNAMEFIVHEWLGIEDAWLGQAAG
ncbi:MAG: CPBP family intramembrane glutamic endopeptidase [Halobacteriaceae archaeon]